jgi:hypothetical protein
LKSSSMFTSAACKNTTVAEGTIRRSSSQHVARRRVLSMYSPLATSSAMKATDMAYALEMAASPPVGAHGGCRVLA